MRWKFTVILLLLNLVAGGYLYYLESGKNLQARLERNSRTIIPAMNNIEELSIDLRGEDGTVQQRVLVRKRDRWELTEPVRWPANDNAVQNILTQLDFLAKQVSIPLADIERLGQSLADFGLAEPRAVIRYRTVDGSEGEIKLGASTKMGRRLYLLPPAGDEVIVVQEDLLAAVAMPLSSLRSLRIFDIPPFEIQSLAVQAGEQRIRLVKTGERWNFETPVSAQADSELVESTLNLLYGQQALQLIKESNLNPDLAGLTNPRMRISLGGNNRRQTLLLGASIPAASLPAGSPPQAYARIDDPQNEGTVFTVMEAPFEQLRQAPDQLRERNFIQLDMAKVSSIQIQRGGQSLTLQKLEQSGENAPVAWQAISGGADAIVRNAPASTTEVQRLLALIGEIDAVQFVSDSPVPSALSAWGLDEPVAQVRMRGADGIDTTLLLGKNVPEQPYLIYAKTRNSNTVYAVESRILTALQTNPLAFRNRRIDPLPENAAVTAVTITDLKDDHVLFSKKRDTQAGNWESVLSSLSDSEKEALRGVLGSIANFTAHAHLAEGTQAPDAMPWRYRMDAEISTAGADGAPDATQTRSYLFSERQGAAQAGASLTAGLTFLLPPELVEHLTPLTLDQRPLTLPATTPDEVKDATLPPLPEEQPQPATPEAAIQGNAQPATDTAAGTEASAAPDALPAQTVEDAAAAIGETD